MSSAALRSFSRTYNGHNNTLLSRGDVQSDALRDEADGRRDSSPLMFLCDVCKGLFFIELILSTHDDHRRQDRKRIKPITMLIILYKVTRLPQEWRTNLTIRLRMLYNLTLTHAARGAGVYLQHFITTNMIPPMLSRWETQYPVLHWYHLVAHHESCCTSYESSAKRRGRRSPDVLAAANRRPSMPPCGEKQERHEEHFMNEWPGNHKSALKLIKHKHHNMIQLCLFGKMPCFPLEEEKDRIYVINMWCWYDKSNLSQSRLLS